MRNRLIILIAAVCGIAGCKGFHEAEFVEVNDLLPVAEDCVEVDAVGGEASLKFYATGKVLAYPLADTEGWAEVLSPSRFNGDGTVTVRFERNHSYRRMLPVRLVLEDKGLEDTLYFKQKGIVPQLSCDTPYSIVDGSADSKVEITLNTNINRNDLNMQIDYVEGASGWIDGLAFSGDIAWDTDDFTFKTIANDADRSDRATVRIWFDDLWREDISVTLYLTRSGQNGKIGTQVSLSELRTRTEPFADDEYMEGYVVSDYRSLNMAENPNTAHDVVDYSVSLRTAYVSAKDGSCGVRLLFDRVEDNMLKPGMKLTLSLDGLSLQKKTSPECFTLAGIATENVLKVENGFSVDPKRKTIGQLVPEDIYTFVTLTDVEFVNKQGAYTNIYEGYGFFDGWGSLLVDAQGAAIFAPVNTECYWRRTGTGVPQGSGTVSGVIVSEDLGRLGNPGDYQIRVVDDTAFDMDEEANLEDFLLWRGKPNEKYPITAAVPAADPGTATLKTEIDAEDISTSSPDQAIRAVANFSGKLVANNGMLNSTALGFYVNLQGWYDFDDNDEIASTNGLVMTFSTKGQTGRLLAYISFLAWGNNGFYRVAPAHWELQYSVDGENYKSVSPSVRSVTPAEYVHLRPGPSGVDYHNGRKYYPSIYMAQGFCDVTYLLPEEVMDKDEVMVRFAPCRDGVLFDFPAEASGFADDIEGNVVKPTSRYSGDIHFAEISFKTINH